MTACVVLSTPAPCAGDNGMDGRWIVTVVISAVYCLAVTGGATVAAEGRLVRPEGSAAERVPKSCTTAFLGRRSGIFDGRTILSSWRRSESNFYRFYRINADGTGLTQLTPRPARTASTVGHTLRPGRVPRFAAARQAARAQATLCGSGFARARAGAVLKPLQDRPAVPGCFVQGHLRPEEVLAGCPGGRRRFRVFQGPGKCPALSHGAG